MSCINRHIDKFCSKFVSVNMNASGFTGPTMEIQAIGDITSGGELSEGSSDYALSQGLLRNLSDAGLAISGNWIVASTKITKSSSGVITTIRLVDKQWTEANNKFVGLRDQVAGDVELGQEYFNVTGVNIGKWGSSSRNLLMNYHSLYNLYPHLNRGKGYIDEGGRYRPNSTELTLEEFFQHYLPGIPDPKVEFGQSLYKASELLAHFGVSNPGIEAYMNQTGTEFDVINGLAAQHGYIYSVSSIFGGKELIQVSSDLGKLNVLESAGIEIPEEASSSSIERDYSAGYSAGGKTFYEYEGRHKDEQSDREEIAHNDRASITYIGGYEHKTISTAGAIKMSDILGIEYNLNNLAWSIIADSAIINELGLAWKIAGGVPVEGAKIDAFSLSYPAVPGYYTFYTNIQPQLELMSNQLAAANALDLVESFNLINAASGVEKCEAFFRNKNRFHLITHVGTKPVTAHGDVSVDGIENFYEQTFGFQNFGTANQNRGSKNWYVSSGYGGEISFLKGSTLVSNSPFDFGVLNPFLPATVGSIDFEGFSNDFSDEFESGAILLDLGENYIPTIETEVYLDGIECFVDSTNSLRDKGGTVFNGVGAINYETLLAEANNLFEYVKGQLENYLGSDFFEAKKPTRPIRDAVGYYGYKESLTKGFLNVTKTNNGKLGNTYTGGNQGGDEQRETLTPESYVPRFRASTSCGKPGGDFNRKFFSFNVKAAAHSEKALTDNGDGTQTIKETGDVYRELTEDGKINSLASHYFQSSGCGVNVPYIDKISFSLINSLYDISPDQEKYLENVSISIVGGKLTANYVFSQKVLIPDYKGLAASRVQLQNVM